MIGSVRRGPAAPSSINRYMFVPPRTKHGSRDQHLIGGRQHTLNRPAATSGLTSGGKSTLQDQVHFSAAACLAHRDKLGPKSGWRSLIGAYSGRLAFILCRSAIGLRRALRLRCTAYPAGDTGERQKFWAEYASQSSARNTALFNSPESEGILMIGGMKIMSVKPGREKQFEQLFRELREEIRRNEPGCMAYVLLSSRMNRDSYVLQEQYVDQAALDAHRASAYGARYFPVIRSLLTGIEVEYFDGVVE